MDCPEEMVQQIINEIPYLNRPNLEGHAKAEAERIFCERFSQFGTLDDFIAKYMGSPPASGEDCLRTIEPVASGYSPEIVNVAPRNRLRFDLFEFLVNNFDRGYVIPLSFQWDDEWFEDMDDEDDEPFADISMREMAKLALTVNHMRDLGYYVIEVKGQKK